MKVTKELIQTSIVLGHYKSHKRSCVEGGGAHGVDEHKIFEEIPSEGF